MSMAGVVRVGTRGSALALAQTGQTVAVLRKKFPKLKFTITVIQTTGDKLKTPLLASPDAKGLFTKELEEALLRHEVDFAVHSLKDLPTEQPRGLKVGAILKRKDPRDCLVSLTPRTLKTLPLKSRVGTSSLRRRAQVAWLRPDVRLEPLRGNLDTRLRRLREGDCDAIIVAAAGLERLKEKISFKGLRFHRIPEKDMLPAVGQGALAVEIRAQDARTEKIVKSLDHAPSRIKISAERAFLRRLEGGCQVPVGVRSLLRGDQIVLNGAVVAPTGKDAVHGSISGPKRLAETLGQRLAEKILNAGGAKILGQVRR